MTKNHQPPNHQPATGAEGSALLVALMAMLLMLALGTTLMLATITETRIASSYGAGIETFYAAEAAIERAMDDLRSIPDWSGLASSATVSTFVDGPPGGTRRLADGTTLDLGEATNMVRAGEDLPWRLFAWGPLAELLAPGMTGGGVPSPYLVVWVARAAEGQGPGPGADPGGAPDGGPGGIALLAHAYGRQGALRAVEVVVTPVDLNGSRGIRLLSWREEP